MSNQPQILFADRHLLLVLKPAGWLTQPALHAAGPNLESWVQQWDQTESAGTRASWIQVVHRLDRSVSGIVLFARSSKALARLNAQMQGRKMEKEYLAWVEGIVENESGHLVHQLLHDDFRARVVASGGKEAILDYTVLKRQPKKTMLSLRLVTGRYHQIRAQLAAIGHPILGDTKYGASPSGTAGQIALHHARFSCNHPISGERLSWESPLRSIFG